ncbi:MAG TPA: carboxypeptidase-like regulatory domain-containing protein, partial [Puia sp.]
MKWKSKWITHSFTFLFVMCLGLQALAQKKITGKVIDSKKSPVAGVTVTIKGISTGTSTNSAGDFSILVPAGNDILIFSSVGYESIE